MELVLTLGDDYVALDVAPDDADLAAEVFLDDLLQGQEQLLTGGRLAANPVARKVELQQFVGALNVDQRSDIYSLGVTLYEALTGQSPFQASSVLMIMKKIADGNYTPLRKINKKFPKKLCALIEKAMHMDPNKRFQTPPEILMAIRKLS